MSNSVTRAITVDRLYSLGDYKNIRFSDTISGIPEHIALDGQAMDLLRFLQMLEVEAAHKRYLKLGERLHLETLDEIIDAIENERQSTWEQLLNKITELEGKEIREERKEHD